MIIHSSQSETCSSHIKSSSAVPPERNWLQLLFCRLHSNNNPLVIVIAMSSSPSPVLDPAPPVTLRQFKVLTFACFGTLIDVERGLINGLKETKLYGIRSDEQMLTLLEEACRSILASFPGMAYGKALEHSLAIMAVLLNVNNLTAAEITRFGSSVPNWPAFPDVVDSLRYFKEYCKLVIVTNVDRESFTQSESKLGVSFDLVVTTDDAETHKPDFGPFNHTLKLIKETWDSEQDEVLHVFQSVKDDGVPANEIGLHTAHIKRVRLSEVGNVTHEPDKQVKLDFEFGTLAELVRAHRNEGMEQVNEEKLFDWDDLI